MNDGSEGHLAQELVEVSPEPVGLSYYQNGQSNGKRFLPFKNRVRRTHEEVVWRLIGRHLSQYLFMKTAIVSFEFTSIPDASEHACKQPVEITISGELVVLTAGDKQC